MEQSKEVGFSTAPKHRQLTESIGKLIITKPNHQTFQRAAVTECMCGTWDTVMSPLTDKIITALPPPWWRRLAKKAGGRSVPEDVQQEGRL